jgi:hypothetical protein
MATATHPVSVSTWTFWAGHIVSGLVGLFMLFDGVMKLIKQSIAVEATVKLGYPESVIVGLGITLTVSTVLYLIPRTAVLGAIFLTGYLGGAVASHVRADDGVFAIVFAVGFGALVWGGLWLREVRVRNLIPLRRY